MDNIEDYFYIQSVQTSRRGLCQQKNTEVTQTVDTERLECSRNPEDDIVLSDGLVDSSHNKIIWRVYQWRSVLTVLLWHYLLKAKPEWIMLHWHWGWKPRSQWKVTTFQFDKLNLAPKCIYLQQWPSFYNLTYKGINFTYCF